MVINPDNLSQYLTQNGLPQVLRIFGDEPLLRDDCLQIIRRYAVDNGIDERQHLIQDAGFDWNSLAAGGQSMSLFSSSKLVELELPDGKPGREGADSLKRYAEAPPPDQHLILCGPKLKKEQLKAKWFTVFDKLGPLIQVSAPDRSRLPAFIHQRAKRHQLQLDDAAVQMLVDWYEGNLLAMDQQLIKLALQNLPQPVTLELVQSHSEDSSRFQVFALQESLLQGNVEQALHRLQRLLSGDVEPAILLWVLQREFQHLWQLKQALQHQQDFAYAAQRLGIWQSQHGAYKAWLERLTPADLAVISDLLCRFELAFKRDSGEHLPTLAVHLVLALSAKHKLPRI
ncbi:MAG: DNA polymerase III subunit delta [Idiomarina sp.]